MSQVAIRLCSEPRFPCCSYVCPELKMSRLEFTDFNKLRAEAQAVAEAKVLADEEYNRALTAWAELQKKIESVRDAAVCDAAVDAS